jgi:ketopantoate reductase
MKTKRLITSVALLSSELIYSDLIFICVFAARPAMAAEWRTKKWRKATILVIMIPVVCLTANGLHNWSLHGKFVMLVGVINNKYQ